MNMKKTLIALAVAGAFAAPAFAATSNVDVYGVMNVALEDTDATGITPAVLSNTSRIGFKGSEDLGGGLKAIWQIENGLSGNGTNFGGAVANRNTFVGLAGDFGTALIGQHDTPYKIATGSLDPFADTIADYNLGRLDGVQLLANGHDARSPNAIAYISPTFSGFHVAAALVANENAGVNDKSMDAVSLAGIYSNGPLFASLAYQDLGDVAGANATNDAWKLGVGYTFGDIKVGFLYEEVDTGAAATDRDSWQINGVYSMGPIAMKAVYGKADVGVGVGSDQDMWALGLDYSMSKRTTAYVVYGQGDNDVGNDVAGWNLGVKHSF
jgi:predicted porin